MRHDDVVIDVRDLRMRYGTTDVLDGVDLQVRRGEVIALLGPNGAGKTTTIEILEGFRNRSGGEVRVLGEDPAAAGEDWRAGIGIVLQSWRDHGRWRVRDLLAHLGRYYVPYGVPGRAHITGVNPNPDGSIEVASIPAGTTFTLWFTRVVGATAGPLGERPGSQARPTTAIS